MPNYYGQYPMYQNGFQNNNQQMQPQIQNGGFVSVRNETEARNYPIAIGTSVTFKDENAPYIYNKTMGFSQLEAPKFDKYRLVKEEPISEPEAETPDKATLDDIKDQISDLWTEIDGIKKKITPKPARKKEGEDE